MELKSFRYHVKCDKPILPTSLSSNFLPTNEQEQAIVAAFYITPRNQTQIKMAPAAAVSLAAESAETGVQDPTVLALHNSLVTESNSLALRFRALFSLKHLASQGADSPQTLPAIEAIAAAFASPSALLKHEAAYCLGQTRNLAAVPYLRAALEDKEEDNMCRHEAAEALGALGDTSSLQLLKALRDLNEEVDVVRETCEIAVARIEWEKSEERKQEKLQQRYLARNLGN